MKTYKVVQRVLTEEVYHVTCDRQEDVKQILSSEFDKDNCWVSSSILQEEVMSCSVLGENNIVWFDKEK